MIRQMSTVIDGFLKAGFVPTHGDVQKGLLRREPFSSVAVAVHTIHEQAENEPLFLKEVSRNFLNLPIPMHVQKA